MDTTGSGTDAMQQRIINDGIGTASLFVSSQEACLAAAGKDKSQ
jgi:hypothetical protein